MDWIPLIAATARLIDLHDSTRVRGEATSQFNLYREVRSGHADGIWLDVALTTIEYLRAREGEVMGGFVSGTELTEALREHIPKLTIEDVKFVLSALTTPAELWYVERSGTACRPLKSTKDTYLVERSRTADAFRLAPAGRTAIALAANVRDIAYIAGSAKNLLTAIKARDFWKITDLSSAIIDVLRAFRLEIESRRERAWQDEVRRFFLQRGEIIREQIAEAAHILLQANDVLSTPSARGDFQTWSDAMEDAGKPSFGHGHAIEILRQVATQTLKLLESFTGLVEESLAPRAETFRPVSFIELSSTLATRSGFDGVYTAFISSFGPIRYKRATPCPFDFLGIFDPTEQAAIEREDIDTTGSEVRETRAMRFMNDHRQAIVAALRRGPLPLHEAFQRGWIDIDKNGVDDISALIGAYCDPSLLDAGSSITVELSKQRDIFTHEPTGRWTFDDLVMTLKEP